MKKVLLLIISFIAGAFVFSVIGGNDFKIGFTRKLSDKDVLFVADEDGIGHPIVATNKNQIDRMTFMGEIETVKLTLSATSSKTVLEHQNVFDNFDEKTINGEVMYFFFKYNLVYKNDFGPTPNKTSYTYQREINHEIKYNKAKKYVISTLNVKETYKILDASYNTELNEDIINIDTNEVMNTTSSLNEQNIRYEYSNNFKIFSEIREIMTSGKNVGALYSLKNKEYSENSVVFGKEILVKSKKSIGYKDEDIFN